MKVAVLIMTTESEPSLTNIEGMKETFIKRTQEGHLDNEYEFILYNGIDSSSRHEYENTKLLEKQSNYLQKIDTGHKNGNVYKIQCDQFESIYKTFEKTIDIFTTLALSKKTYDWYIRINISAWLNIDLIDKILPQLDNDKVYCNAINSIISDEKYLNDLYPRGDFMMFSAKVKAGIYIEGYKFYNCDKRLDNRLNVPHVDDCLIGLSLIHYFGKDYYKHLKMLTYNYLPQNKFSKEKLQIKRNAVCSRVKTVPPGETYSGYSWNDNEWRRYDKEKMLQLSKMYKDIDYTNINLSDIIVSENKGRLILLVLMQNATVDNFYKILENKRK